MKFDDLPFAGQIAVIAGLCLGLAFVFYQFIYSPLVEEVERLEKEKSEAQEQINKYLPFANKEPQLREEIAQIKGSLDQLERIFPSTKNDVEIKRFVEDIAEEYDIDILSMTVDGIIEEPNYLERPINYDTRGRTIDLLRFFDALARRDQVIHIYGLTMSQLAERDSENGRYPVSARFRISSYVYKPVEETVSTEQDQ